MIAKLNIKRIVMLPINLKALLLACFVLLSTPLTFADTVSYPLSLSTGWSLVGNSLTTPVNVQSIFGTQTNITSVWKWNAASSQWEFYAPSLDAAGTLPSYAASKGYGVLSTINQGDGFWVNAKADIDLGTQNGTGFSLAASSLVTGWNLVATGDKITPATLTTNVGNITSLWAWDNVHSAWYFYAPSLVANSTMADYIQSKGYEDFGAQEFGGGLGFWVYYAGGNTPPSNSPVATVVVIVTVVM